MIRFMSRSTWGLSDYLALVAMLLSFALTLIWLITPVERYIHVHSTEVYRLPDGRLAVLVDRTLNGDFEGQYQGGLRDRITGAPICNSGWITVPYRQHTESGSLTDLPNPTPLSYWVAGGSCTGYLVDEILPARVGAYSLEVCHRIRPLGLLPWKKRCWPPVPFTVPVDHETKIGLQRVIRAAGTPVIQRISQ